MNRNDTNALIIGFSPLTDNKYLLIAETIVMREEKKIIREERRRAREPLKMKSLRMAGRGE